MIDFIWRAAVSYGCELIEEGTRKARFELSAQVVRFGQVLLSQFAQALLAVNTHKHRGHQRDERLIRTDVRRGFFAPNVLLARGQGEAESAVATRITSFAH